MVKGRARSFEGNQGRRRPTAVALVLTLLSLTTPAAADPQAPTTRRLAPLVHEYVMTGDRARADALLQSILNEPGATIEAVQAILHAGPRYAPRPVGLLPSQPVQSRGRQHSFGLYVPASYTPDQTYPLVICLHGAGFTGDAYLERWQPRLADRYILACPTLYRGDWWTLTAEHLVLATLRTVAAQYRIDHDRVFLTGMSNGGIGAWLIGSHHAPLFAGLAPMAGGLDEVLFPFLDNLRNTPVYIIHGRRDQVMPVDLSRSIARRLTELGYAYVFREHDHVHPMAGGHFFPREELPALVAWLDVQRRGPSPHTIVLVRDASHLGTFGWVRIDATDRIAALTENLIEGRDELIKNRVYARLEAEIIGPNRIAVRTERVRRLTLFLNETLIDRSRPVTVLINGVEAHAGRVDASLTTLLRQVRLRGDWSRLYPVEIRLSVPDLAPSPSPQPSPPRGEREDSSPQPSPPPGEKGGRGGSHNE